jgi:hypothetical protein
MTHAFCVLIIFDQSVLLTQIGRFSPVLIFEKPFASPKRKAWLFIIAHMQLYNLYSLMLIFLPQENDGE